MTRDDVTPALLDRYLAGECTPEEVPFVHACLDADTSVQVLLGQIRQVRQAAALGGMWEVNGLWRRVKQGLDTDMASQAPSTVRTLSEPAAGWSAVPGRAHLASPGGGMSVRGRSARPALKGIGVLGTQALRKGMWSVATAVALGIVIFLMGWNRGGHHTSQRVMTYATGNGERATITLPDGGTVALNVASRLEVPLDYMTGSRTVRLVGEGFFTVPHHAGVPLTILAGTTTAQVLGTSFVVRHYAADTAAMVAVRDGKVAVGTTIVTANQLVEVGQSGAPHLRSTDATPFTFTRGILTIDSLSLPDAIVELDRWFDVDIRLGDPMLATQFVRGTFASGSPGSLKEILELTFNVRVMRDGRVLTLFPRR